ncbi:uncharacterized protein saturn [Drosophila takahashii]|uniref:uncharacterized protein saturn n=1 Tax=Drosophila takahashii TaxID=29030 RepID=UPI001CF80F48|nr:uncharacterized protein LOC108057659 [Drosophila takahashii]
MWEYRHDIDFQTSVKISPYCYTWQSVCWFMLKGLDLWRFLVWDRSPTYLVILTIVLIGLSWLAVKSFRRRWNEVPMSEIQSLRDRVQFVNQDMVMLQDALNAAIVSQPQNTKSDEDINVFDALYEAEAKNDGETSLESPESAEIPEPTTVDQEENSPEPEIAEHQPQEVPLVKNRVRFEENLPVNKPPTPKKPIIKPKPKRSISQNTRDLKDKLDEPSGLDQINIRKRPIPISGPEWKI